jgi:hypothetical protein
MSVDESVAVGPWGSTSVPPWDAGRSLGRLVVAWQNPEDRRIVPVGMLEHGYEGYRFRYLRRASRTPGFRPFLSFPEWYGDYRSEWLFPLFAQRIMSPRRPDFQDFLHQLDLAPGATPWEQLARSEGRSSGDTVQVFPVPTVQADGLTTCMFLVHGVRYCNGGQLPPLVAGQEVKLRDQPTNPKNPLAVQVVAQDVPIGWVPDLLLGYIREVREEGSPRLTVQHVNGPTAPPHLRVLLYLQGVLPPGRRPMTGPDWETFVE